MKRALLLFAAAGCGPILGIGDLDVAPAHDAGTSLPTRWTTMRPGSAGGVTKRADFSAVWTGSQLLVFGGGSGDGGAILANGGIYTPADDTWSVIAPGMLAERFHHAAVWSGSEMIVWGGENTSGRLEDGARYDPAARRWTAIAKVRTALPAFELPRIGASAVWSETTEEMILWGGTDANNHYWASGAAYKPKTDSWRLIAASPLLRRAGAVALWTGDRALFYGGTSDGGSAEDGALYDPKADAWSPIFAGPPGAHGPFDAVAWSGSTSDPVAFFGGIDESRTAWADGWTLDVKSLQFATIAPQLAVIPPKRENGGGWMSHGRLWLWGGKRDTGAVVGDGASFDLSARTWSILPTEGAPSPREQHCVVWTGKEAIVWGGRDAAGNALDDGARFAP